MIPRCLSCQGDASRSGIGEASVDTLETSTLPAPPPWAQNQCPFSCMAHWWMVASIFQLTSSSWCPVFPMWMWFFIPGGTGWLHLKDMTPSALNGRPQGTCSRQTLPSAWKPPLLLTRCVPRWREPDNGQISLGLYFTGALEASLGSAPARSPGSFPFCPKKPAGGAANPPEPCLYF